MASDDDNNLLAGFALIWRWVVRFAFAFVILAGGLIGIGLVVAAADYIARN